MSGILKALFAEVVALTAPVVCLVYRRGWFLTPDDPVSPFGSGTTPGASREPAVVAIYERFGKFVGDWYWLGIRNRGYGLSYALKPARFKALTTYNGLPSSITWRGPVRIVEVDGFREYVLHLGFAHVIAGYRMRPVWDAIHTPGLPYRAINMDARPIISIRAGKRDD